MPVVLFCSLFVIVLKVPVSADPVLVFCAVLSSYKAVEMVSSLFKPFFIFLQFLNVSISVISANGISKEAALFSSHC